MSIDHATVRRMARLAHIAIDEADVPRLTGELTRVLDMVGRLADADLASVEPMAHPHAQTLVWRSDEMKEPDRADAFLALAPEARGGLYLVPKVIE